MLVQLNFTATLPTAQNHRIHQATVSFSKVRIAASRCLTQGRNTHYDEEEFKLDV